jgi:NAD(P)-dependent dehydrogenase (short-subunit alcohol dehydrogenase family)
VSAGLLRDRVCVISGVGAGLGRSIATAFAREGARLVLGCRTEATARAIADELTAAGAAPPIAVAADVTRPEDRARLIAAAVDDLGGIDVLVNNAFATGRPGPIVDTDVTKAWRAPFEVNLFATLALSQAALPSMKARGGGAIVMINSLAARKRQPGLAGYGASKAALLAAAESLAAEVGRDRIRVNSVVPSHIDGPNLRAYFQMEARRLGVDEAEVYRRIAAEGVMDFIPTSAQVAEVVTFLASDMAAAVTGQSIDVNCGQFFH